MARRTEVVSVREGTAAGERREERRTASESATVIPPPVSGCRMLRASPSSIRPGAREVEAGRNELGMLRSPPLSRASRKLGCTA